MWPPSSGRNGNRLMIPSDSEISARTSSASVALVRERLLRRGVAVDDAVQLLVAPGARRSARSSRPSGSPPTTGCCPAATPRAAGPIGQCCVGRTRSRARVRRRRRCSGADAEGEQRPCPIDDDPDGRLRPGTRSTLRPGAAVGADLVADRVASRRTPSTDDDPVPGLRARAAAGLPVSIADHVLVDGDRAGRARVSQHPARSRTRSGCSRAGPAAITTIRFHTGWL